ncbi:sigma-54-dependent Fis family transcriptional regulator [uncultured Desulfobacter sp.]|uniref:sigma-54 interaction domain-containing protein n=1 Tax=uncultured Desulfobacter sp. TaxID=240139 RepID=UPI002AAB20FA|nr:sigma-54-dependent Fis family transcriptional regulator [uncultured Desulfobacter sp.]
MNKEKSSQGNYELFRELDPEILQKKFLHALLKIQNVKRGSIWIKRDRTYVCVEAAGIDSENIVGVTLDAGSPSIVGWVIENGEMTIAKAGSDRRHNREMEAHFAVKSSQILCFPLLIDGQVFGAVQIIDTNPDNIHLNLDSSYLSHFQNLVEICSIALGNALSYASEQRKNRRLSSVLSKIEKGNTIIGQSKAFQKSMDLVKSYADTDFNVLITGESGTGKELVAEYLHKDSSRADYPFLAQNCSAIPETLLESELFGYKKGAFTGAVRDRAGLFEAADGGTVFLDEIGDMSMGIQAGLLRVLQKNEIKPLGSTTVRHINVRIIAATNKDLGDMIQTNRFRQDLYYRLSVLPVHLPPLRERREDIPLLARHFLATEGRKTKILEKKMSSEALHHLVSYAWPGNIRELENLIRYLMVTAPDEIIHPEDLPEHILKNIPDGATAHATPQDCASQTKEGPYLRDISAMTWPDLEKAYVETLMEKFNWNVTWAAKASGINRSTFVSRMRKLDIHRGTPPL